MSEHFDIEINHLKEKKGAWKFDKDVTPVFDEHVRKSVPLYDEFHRMIDDYSTFFIEDNTNFYDIGTSTGETIKNLSNTHEGKKVQYIGIDTSESMVQEAIKRFSDRSDVNIIYGDVTKDDIVLSNASFITSVLAAQFISVHKRQIMFDKVYKGLNKGGAFILVEKIIGTNARIDQMYVQMYHDLKIRNSLSVNHVFEKSKSIRSVMRPNTLEENIDMLYKAGFKTFEIFFKWNNFVGIIAIK